MFLSSMCRRILSVGDCPSFADRVALVLERLGHQVRIACDRQAAVVVAQNFQPEAVLLDTVRDVDSRRAAFALRSVLVDEHTPIIAINPSHEEDRNTSGTVCKGQFAKPGHEKGEL